MLDQHRIFATVTYLAAIIATLVVAFKVCKNLGVDFLRNCGSMVPGSITVHPFIQHVAHLSMLSVFYADWEYRFVHHLHRRTVCGAVLVLHHLDPWGADSAQGHDLQGMKESDPLTFLC